VVRVGEKEQRDGERWERKRGGKGEREGGRDRASNIKNTQLSSYKNIINDFIPV
jgi:hypothetical protein